MADRGPLPERRKAATYMDSGVAKDGVRTAVSQREQIDDLTKEVCDLKSEREAGRLGSSLLMVAFRLSSKAFDDANQGNTAMRTASWDLFETIKPIFQEMMLDKEYGQMKEYADRLMGLSMEETKKFIAGAVAAAEKGKRTTAAVTT